MYSDSPQNIVKVVFWLDLLKITKFSLIVMLNDTTHLVKFWSFILKLDYTTSAWYFHRSYKYRSQHNLGKKKKKKKKKSQVLPQFGFPKYHYSFHYFVKLRKSKVSNS